MTTVAQFLAACAKDIGYTESPPGSNKTKFAACAGHANGQPWCATWLACKAKETGLQLPSTSAYTPTMFNGFKAAGRSGSAPRAGAFAFWDFPDDLHRIQHVSVVVSWEQTTVSTIDGNSSVSGSQSNGGQVVRRTRSRSQVVGYGYPVYVEAPAPQPHPIPEPPEDDMKVRLVQFEGEAPVYACTPAGLDHVSSSEYAAFLGLDLATTETIKRGTPAWDLLRGARSGRRIVLHD